MIYDAFISCSPSNDERLKKLIVYLESKKIICWVYPRNLYPGILQDKSKEIAIQASRSLIFLYSLEGNEFVLPDELFKAKELGINIIPIKINKDDNTDIFNEIIPPENWLICDSEKEKEPFKPIFYKILDLRNKVNNKLIDNFLPIKDNLIHHPMSDSLFSKKLKTGFFILGIIVSIVMVFFLYNLKNMNPQFSIDGSEQTKINPEQYGGYYSENNFNNLFFCSKVDTLKRDFYSIMSVPTYENFSIVTVSDLPLGYKSVKLHLNKFNPDSNKFEFYSSREFEIDNEWNNLYFNKLSFQETGIFRAILTTTDNVNLVSGIIFVSNSDTLNNTENPLLFFCESYSDKPVNTSDRFTTGSLSIVFESKNPLNLNKVFITIEKLQFSGMFFDQIYEKDFKIDPNWNIIHFDEIPFEQTGFFKVSILNKNYEIITSNILEIVEK